MKTLRNLTAAFALLLAVVPAVAQWQTPNHSVPIGRGGGVTGFSSAAPGTAGVPLVSTGLGLDPTFSPATNAGIRPGAADTYKGSVNGTTTADVAWPPCTALGSAIRYAAGVGPNCGTVIALTGFDMPINLGLSSSASVSSLTLTVTQANGSAPTASNPVVVPFRSTTAANGSVVLGTISSTLSLTIPGGATLGTQNSIPFRLWIFLNYNGGTPALGVATCSNSNVTTAYPCAAWETSLKTSTTISAAAATSGVLYAGVGVANDSVRIVGYCDYGSGLVTAGTYASACTTLQLMGPGVKKPGDVVQSRYSTSSTQQNVLVTTPVATSATVSGTLTSAMNFFMVKAAGLYGSAIGASTCRAKLGKDSNANLFGNETGFVAGAGVSYIGASAFGYNFPNDTSSHTYSLYIYIGTTPGSSCTYPDASASGAIELQEIMG